MSSMNSYSRGPDFENHRSGSLKTLNGSASTASLTKRLRENALTLHNKEYSDKHNTSLSRQQSSTIETKPEDLAFKVILPRPVPGVLISAPKECKVVRELSPGEKHKVKLNERRERLKAKKNNQALARSLLGKGLINGKEREYDRLVYKGLDKMMHPEAQNGGMLDLSRQEFLVNNTFSFDKSTRLNHPSHSPENATLATLATSTIGTAAGGDSQERKIKMTRQQKMLQNVKSKFMDASKFHSQRLLSNEPNLKQFVIKKRERNQELD